MAGSGPMEFQLKLTTASVRVRRGRCGETNIREGLCLWYWPSIFQSNRRRLPMAELSMKPRADDAAIHHAPAPRQGLGRARLFVKVSGPV